MFKVFVSLLTIIITPICCAQDVPQSIEIEGKFQFNIVDSSKKLIVGKYVESPVEITSASHCSIQLSAYDDFYNVYSTQINLTNVQNDIFSYFQVESQYINEDGNYLTNKVSSASFQVGPLIANSSKWQVDHIKGTYLLTSPSLSEGRLAFHHISLGQPIKINIESNTKPTHVTINIPAVKSKTASIIRRCMELIG